MLKADRDINEAVVYLCKQGLWFKSALEHLAAVVTPLEISNWYCRYYV